MCVLLVDSRRRAVTRYTRNADGGWSLYDFDAGAVRLEAIGVTLELDDLYEGAEGLQGWG